MSQPSCKLFRAPVEYREFSASMRGRKISQEDILNTRTDREAPAGKPPHLDGLVSGTRRQRLVSGRHKYAAAFDTVSVCFSKAQRGLYVSEVSPNHIGR